MPTVSKGALFRRPDSPHWFIKLHVDYRVHRESTGTDDRERALAHLQRRIQEARSGRLLAHEQRITFEEMRDLLLANYRFKRNRTDPSRHVRRLAESFSRASRWSESFRSCRPTRATWSSSCT